MVGGHRRGAPRRPVLLLSGGVLAAVLVVGVAVWAYGLPAYDQLVGAAGNPAATAHHKASGKAGKSTRARHTPAHGRSQADDDHLEIASCAAATDKGRTAMVTAHASVIGDWAAHIQAMTDLLSGANTQAETDRIWTMTRLRGPERLKLFRAADSAYQKVHDVCADIDASHLTRDDRPKVAGCVHLADRTETALAAGKAAAGEWGRHLKAMAAFRGGQLNPMRAQSRWLGAYRKAPTNIHRFQRTEHAYTAARHECSLG